MISDFAVLTVLVLVLLAGWVVKSSLFMSEDIYSVRLSHSKC
jgi:hypothetical protein